MFGYMGQILRVDLTKGKVSKEALKENDCKMFLGGSGLATKYLFDEVPKGTDPLGPKNKLIFMTGPADRHRIAKRRKILCSYQVASDRSLGRGELGR